MPTLCINITCNLSLSRPARSYPGLQASASYRQLNTVGGCHQYTVAGFSLARNLGAGTRLCSDLFDVAGQLFRLEIYPAGRTHGACANGCCLMPVAAKTAAHTSSMDLC